MRSAVSSVIAAARQRYAVAKGGTVAFLAMRATRGALGTNFCYGCGGDTLLATGTTVVRCHCAVARASGSGTFQWLVVRCGGERRRGVVTGGSGGSTR